MQRALVSVYDKTGLEDLARGLHEHGVEIVSTGSTAKAIEAAGVPVTPVSAVTSFPEILDGVTWVAAEDDCRVRTRESTSTRPRQSCSASS